MWQKLLVVAALYEPVRNALYRLDDDVGGVGGVGGLTNQWGCDERNGPFGDYVCFHRGVALGFTPFALVVLLVWIVPLAASSEIPMRVWRALELLWFAVPAAAYLSDPFYNKDLCHVVLGVAIAAAFPLSWHLAFVALPDVQTHKMIAWSAVRWGAVHAGGELAYTLVKTPRVFVQDMYLIFWAGAATLFVGAVHVGLALFRHRLPDFVTIHRIGAALLLLCATWHWWPFAFFLGPVVAFQAAGRQHERLAPAIAGYVAGLCVVWQLRQTILLHTHDTNTAFVFPPLAVVSGYVIARLAVAAVGAPSQRSKDPTPARNDEEDNLQQGQQLGQALLDGQAAAEF